MWWFCSLFVDQKWRSQVLNNVSIKLELEKAVFDPICVLVNFLDFYLTQSILILFDITQSSVITLNIFFNLILNQLLSDGALQNVLVLQYPLLKRKICEW
jgi:hypothetical protein